MKKSIVIALVTLIAPLSAFGQDEVVQEEAMVEAPPIVVAEVEEVATEPTPSFLENVNWLLMASGNYMFNAHRVSGPYNSAATYPYTNSMGFGLNFAGADASYTGDKWGITMGLRFGVGAELLTPIAPLKQGYISYMPMDKLTFDMGWFDTIYGAEVADEWVNVNYSRGALYFLRQPFNHMGVRAKYAVNDDVGLTFMLSNGGVLGGVATDLAKQVPAIGWQVALAPMDDFALIIGGNHAPNGNNGNKVWEHFLDIVATYTIDDFALIGNADFTISPDGPNTGSELEALYGFSLAGMYAFNDKSSAGVRFEYLDGNSNSGSDYLITLTPTFRYNPVEYLTFSLEPRLEFAENKVFANRDGDGEKIYFGIILGASAHIGN